MVMNQCHFYGAFECMMRFMLGNLGATQDGEPNSNKVGWTNHNPNFKCTLPLPTNVIPKWILVGTFPSNMMSLPSRMFLLLRRGRYSWDTKDFTFITWCHFYTTWHTVNSQAALWAANLCTEEPATRS
jgi:hypothetical protein